MGGTFDEFKAGVGQSDDEKMSGEQPNPEYATLHLGCAQRVVRLSHCQTFCNFRIFDNRTFGI